MIRFHAAKRLFCVCVALVVSLFVCVAAYADDVPPVEPLPDSSAPPGASSDSVPPEPAQPDSDSSDSESAPSNSENTPSSDSVPPASDSMPPASDSTPPASDSTPPVSDSMPSAADSTPSKIEQDELTPEPLLPEYTVESAMDYLAQNGISLMAASSPVPGTDTTVPNFPGMHRVYMGRTNKDAPLEIDIYRLLPDLYTRLTVDNFCAIPVSFVSGYSASSYSDSFSYNSETGILTCPYLYKKVVSSYGFPIFDIYCYYNDSVTASPAVVPVVTTRSCLGAGNVGADVELPNFPGLHRRYLNNAPSSNTADGWFHETFPDLFPKFTFSNFGFSPYAADTLMSLRGVNDPVLAYNVTTGHYYIYPCSSPFALTNNTGDKFYVFFSYDAFLFYNIPEEMEFYEPDPTPPDPPTPDVPGDDDPPAETVAPHPFWSTDFADYTVSEGLLFLVFCLLALYGVIKIFR